MNPCMYEPNPASDRELKPSFYNERISYVEQLVASHATRFGLLPMGNRRPHAILQIRTGHLIDLPSFLAIGEQGHLIRAGMCDPYGDTLSYDAAELPQGSYALYACLTYQKTPCGPPIELHDTPGLSIGRVVERFQRNCVRLEIDQDRLKHRDWLHVGNFRRESRLGVLHTILDERFHPVITGMQAYCHPINPVARFAEISLDRLPAQSDRLVDQLIRMELLALRQIADIGTPEFIYLQIQRCLMMLTSIPDRLGWPVDILTGRSFEPSEFCAFLALLMSVLTSGTAELLPQMLTIGSRSYVRKDGVMEYDSDFCVWKTAEKDFLANSVVLLIPRAADLPG